MRRAISHVANLHDDDGQLVRATTDSLGRAHGPFILAGVPGGEIRITNDWLPQTALPLYRFATLDQARAGAAIIQLHARHGVDCADWHVPEVRAHRPLYDIAGALTKLEAWAHDLEPELRAGMAAAGAETGHYSMLRRRLTDTPEDTLQ